MFIFTSASVVPIISAISLYVFPSMSRSWMTVRCFSGSLLMSWWMWLIFSSRTSVSWMDGWCSSCRSCCSSSSGIVWLHRRALWSSARLRAAVMAKDSKFCTADNSPRRSHNFSKVSCTTSSASSRLSVMRRAVRKRMFFSGSMSRLKSKAGGFWLRTVIAEGAG